MIEILDIQAQVERLQKVVCLLLRIVSQTDLRERLSKEEYQFIADFYDEMRYL